MALVRSVEHVAFLGGINVGGHRVTMDRLREEVRAIGMADVRTFIASGNVLFTAPARPDPAAALADGLTAALGYRVPVWTRTAAEVRTLAATLPFGALADGHTHMVLLFEAPPAGGAGDEPTGDRFVLDGREVHWFTPGRMSDSAFTLPKLTKRFGAPFTSRNSTMLRKLVGELRS